MRHDLHEQQTGAHGRCSPRSRWVALVVYAISVGCQAAQANAAGIQKRWLAAQVSGEKEFFANLVVDAVLRLDLQTLDLRMIGMKKVRLWRGGHLPSWLDPASCTSKQVWDPATCATGW